MEAGPSFVPTSLAPGPSLPVIFPGDPATYLKPPSTGFLCNGPSLQNMARNIWKGIEDFIRKPPPGIRKRPMIDESEEETARCRLEASWPLPEEEQRKLVALRAGGDPCLSFGRYKTASDLKRDRDSLLKALKG
jgi:hypothetical protein